MFANVINALSVFLGATIGLKLGYFIPSKIKAGLLGLLGLIVMLLGIQMAIKTESVIGLLISAILGMLIGEYFNLQQKINLFFHSLSKNSSKANRQIIQAFITSSLVFCGGPMTIIGTLKAGLNNNNEILLIKSTLDGITAIPLASTLGIGVLFSSAFVLVFQSILMILSQQLRQLLTENIIRELTAIAGLNLALIGLDLLGLNKKLTIINLLPAMLLNPFITFLLNRI